jgi:hypothetical protein
MTSKRSNTAVIFASFGSATKSTVSVISDRDNLSGARSS